MDNDTEDTIVDIKCTDSQKSVTTSNVYSTDFTDSGSDKNNSSGKETYIIECDDSDDSEIGYELNEKPSIINLKDKATTRVHVIHNVTVNCKSNGKVSKSTSDTFQKCSIAQETFTQTSKTIIELAKCEKSTNNSSENKSLETQTSLQSITQNGTNHMYEKQDTRRTNLNGNCIEEDNSYETNNEGSTNNNICAALLVDGSSKLFLPTDNEIDVGSRSQTSSQNTEQIPEKIENGKHLSDDNSLGDLSYSDTDMDEDSLMGNEYNDNNCNADNTSGTSDVPKSLDSEMENLYKRISEKDNANVKKSIEQDNILLVNTLTPLTEESVIMTESLMDITPHFVNMADTWGTRKHVTTLQCPGNRINNLVENESTKSRKYLHLPPIKNNQTSSCTPRLNFLFSEINQKPCEWYKGDRWEIVRRDLAAGESPLISGKSDTLYKVGEEFQLPAINIEQSAKYRPKSDTIEVNSYSAVVKDFVFSKPQTLINIKDEIEELKMVNTLNHRQQAKNNTSTTDSRTSRSVSPDSLTREDNRQKDLADRGCEALCMELLRRLKSNAWLDVSDTLEELPQMLENFWGVISENRTADLIRQVSNHVDSPRTQVAKVACSALAVILKNTSYTKKPEFFEAVASLLVKTGSYSRPVRRAANMALDTVVCGVELAHAVTAICVHGTSHKSPLVRMAAARLLVVSCALGGGGRELLRARPPSAACARRHALRALAALLEDRNTDTRKYAERLYVMLRPLSNFEAYYLTDVEVEVASRQMKKFDQLLLCGSKETR